MNQEQARAAIAKAIIKEADELKKRISVYKAHIKVGDFDRFGCDTALAAYMHMLWIRQSRWIRQNIDGGFNWPQSRYHSFL